MSDGVRAVRGGTPSTAFGGPPPRVGEDFGGAAGRLAGFAGLAFGWTPDSFWRATPAELVALVRAASPGAVAPPDGDMLSRLMEQFPDG